METPQPEQTPQPQQEQTPSNESAMHSPAGEPKKSRSKTVLIVLIILATIVVLGIAGWLVYSRSVNKSKNTTAQTQVEPNIQTAEVSITAAGFNPSTVKIKKGDQVMWKNTDSKPHRIFAEPYPTKSSLPDLDSESLAPQSSYGFIFEQTGTFKYTDYNNPTKYLGTVIVE